MEQRQPPHLGCYLLCVFQSSTISPPDVPPAALLVMSQLEQSVAKAITADTVTLPWRLLPHLSPAPPMWSSAASHSPPPLAIPSLVSGTWRSRQPAPRSWDGHWRHRVLLAGSCPAAQRESTRLPARLPTPGSGLAPAREDLGILWGSLSLGVRDLGFHLGSLPRPGKSYSLSCTCKMGFASQGLGEIRLSCAVNAGRLA